MATGKAVGAAVVALATTWLAGTAGAARANDERLDHTFRMFAVIVNNTSMTGSASLHGETTQQIGTGEEYRHTSHWSMFGVGGRGYHLWLDFGDRGKCLVTVGLNTRLNVDTGGGGYCELLSDQSWGDGFRCEHRIEWTDTRDQSNECRVVLGAR